LNFEVGTGYAPRRLSIAEATIERDYACRPLLLDRYGEEGRSRYREDILYNLTALSAAVDADDSRRFLRYVAWLKIVLVTRGVDCGDIAESLRCIAFALNDDAVGDHSIAASYLQDAMLQLDSMPAGSRAFSTRPKTITSSLSDACKRCCASTTPVARGSGKRARRRDAVGANLYWHPPPLMREVGRLWQMNQISVAHRTLLQRGDAIDHRRILRPLVRLLDLVGALDAAGVRRG